jgi:hypothetical protein
MSTQDEAVSALYKQVSRKRRMTLKDQPDIEFCNVKAHKAMLDVLERVKVIWDREGIGSDENESEPLYNDLCEAISKGKETR